ncbi:MAG: PRC-barrel domain-containing protein [Ferruginibacter sp.]
MQRNIKSLIGYSIEATDGRIGELNEFYFEDNTWLIRYLIIKTGNWFLNRKVLISPYALLKKEKETCILSVNISKEKVRTSPDIDTDKPVSKQYDIELYGHYSWPLYAGSGFYAGGSEAAMNDAPVIDERILKEADGNDKGSDDDLHLRSTKTVTGYHIHAIDGDFGHVTDFIVDDSNWKIKYLVVDSHNWFGGKKYLVETDAVKEIQWDNSKVILNITKAGIEEGSLFDESQFNYSQSIAVPSESIG